jgi:hypothetical protein
MASSIPDINAPRTPRHVDATSAIGGNSFFLTLTRVVRFCRQFCLLE